MTERIGIIKRVGPFTANLVDSFCKEMSTNDNQERMKLSLIDPFISHIATKLQPYIVALLLMFSVFFVLILLILIIILKN